MNEKVYLAANNIAEGAERGLILHEVGVHHGLRDVLGDRYDTMIRQLQRQVERGGQEGSAPAQRQAYEAHQRALRDPTIQGDEAAIWEETIAYMAEAGADTSLFRQIVSAIRNFLRGWGLVRGFTNADVAHLARGSVARIVSGAEAGDGAVYAPAAEAPLYSRASDWGGQVTLADSTFEAAVDALMERQGGYVEGALVHPDIGPIDLVWGQEGTAARDFDEGFGLAKIIRKHPEVEPKRIQELLHGARVVPAPREERRNRVKLESDDHYFVVSQEWRGERARWLLTAYGKGEASPGRSVYVAGRTDSEHPSEQEASSAAPQGRIIGVAEGTASERPSGQEAADIESVSPAEDGGQVRYLLNDQNNREIEQAVAATPAVRRKLEKGQPISRRDVLDPLLKGLDVPVYHRRVKKGESKCLPKRQAIRVRAMNDVQATTFELGYLLRERFGELPAKWTGGANRNIRNELQALSNTGDQRGICSFHPVVPDGERGCDRGRAAGL